MFDGVEAAFDDVAAAVGAGIEGRRSAALAAASTAVSGLVCGFGDDGLNPAAAQQGSVRAGGVGLVGDDSGRSGAWRCVSAGDVQVREQGGQHRGIPAMSGGDEHDQGSSGAVDKLMDLARQAPAGAPECVIGRLTQQVGGQILVIQPSRLCAPGRLAHPDPGARWRTVEAGSSHADAPG